MPNNLAVKCKRKKDFFLDFYKVFPNKLLLLTQRLHISKILVQKKEKWEKKKKPSKKTQSKTYLIRFVLLNWEIEELKNYI